jgi:hypothetical protein
VTIDLTPDVIAASKERDSSHCMIAEAVKVAFPGATYVSVDLQTIRFSDPAKRQRYTYLTPRSAQIALIEFDQGTTPEPFSFHLRHGQVTFSGSRPSLKAKREAGKDAGAAELEVNEAGFPTGNLVESNAQKARNVKARLVRRDGSDTDPERSRPVPEKIGGRTPPTTPFARRRAFGLRALER